ncbi:quinone oxidoreductase family protein [Lentzea cavernae]|uniref:Oxidoreductase n=1 Tax=Lentzea cavernae TaxID=2020703 RepID=A0ABQ3M1R8_9PSEU|nr:zinc-binding dehydrogenase [Lentzea cavernae]GHH30654.1 oxidoreductase [Lentzea cavernae]
MRAAVVQESGKLETVEVPDPVPGPGQVLVEVEAIGAGFVDVMVSRGEYPGGPGGPGAVPGVEVTGRVSAVGPDADGDLVGRRVLALTGTGGYAELAVAGAVLPVPEDADAAEVLALGTNALVAELALRRAGTAAGNRVLVRGAGGGIGVPATQLARAAGADVTAVTSSQARGERLRELGATRIFDRTAAALPDGSYDVVVDTVAGPDTGKHLGLLRDNGRYVLVGAAGGMPGNDVVAALLGGFHRSPSLLAFSLNSVAAPEVLRSWQEITTLWQRGELTPVVHDRLKLSEADHAVELLGRGAPFGKLVLLPR